MKVQLSHNALWLAFAFVVLAFARVGQPQPVMVHQFDLTGSAFAKNDSYCGNGIKGQYSSVHRSWVCSTELTAAPHP